jgi:hypothetical protein
MRRSYISPEYNSVKVYGTFNMIEESNFFSSKMMDIEDVLNLSTLDIIYYQNKNGEQLDLSIESSFNPIYYSIIGDKLSNHTLDFDVQSNSQKNTNTKWVLTININNILSNYLFATIKRWRSFEGIRNQMVRSGDVNIALSDYIRNNVLDRYKLSNIDLLISYKDLRNQNLLRWKNNWNENLDNKSSFRKVTAETSTDGSIVKLFFTQEKSSSEFSFDYFFNLNFEKK